MAHPYKNDPVVSELDDIAQELEKTGNADLATLVDEVSAELITAKRSVAAKKSEKKEPAAAAKVRSKKNRKPAKKEADTNHGSRRAKIASAMRKIARAQVAELEDIAAELLKEGEKKAALEVLKIAEDLDSDYEYSSDGKHSSPESKGDASKRFNRSKANKPDAKMDADEKERLEPPFGEKGEGYPLKQSAFDKQLDDLIRLAMEEEEAKPELDGASPLGEEDSSEESPEDSDEDDGDLDTDGLDEGDEEEGDESTEEGNEASEGEDADDMDLNGLDLGDGDDELAAMMKDMEPDDMEASSDRMYESEDAPEGDEGDEGDEEEAEMPGMEEESLEDEEEEDEPEDEEASALGGLQGASSGASLGGMVGGPAGAVAGGLGGAALGLMASAENKTKMLALAKKLAAKGEKALATRVAKLAQTKKK